MTTEPSTPELHRRMWRLAGPIILANSSAPLLGAVDTAVMGHMPDPLYLGAIALGALVFSFLYWGLGFLRMGTTGLTAQGFGAFLKTGDATDTGAAFSRAAMLAIGFGCLVILLQKPLGLIAFSLLDADASIEIEAQKYYAIRIWSAPAALINFVVLGWLLGIQKAGSALLIQVVLNALNACLDVLFVFGFGWGVEGVAFGTIIAETTAATLGIVIIRQHFHRHFTLSLRSMLTARILKDMAALQRIIVVNTDIFLRTACILLVFGIFTNTGAQFGATTLAANALLLNFLMFMAHGLDGFAFAAEAMVGAEKGQRGEKSLHRVVKVTSQWAFLAAMIYVAVYALLGPSIIRLLTDLPDVRALADAHLPWMAIMPLIAVWSFQLDGIFVGLTRTRAMRNTVAVALGIFLIALPLLTPNFGNHGLWAAFTIFMVARGLTLAWCYGRLVQSLAAPTNPA